MNSLKRIRIHIKDNNQANKTITGYITQRTQDHAALKANTNRSMEESHKHKKSHDKLKFELSLIRRDIETKYNSSKIKEYKYPLQKHANTEYDTIIDEWENKSEEYSGYFQEHIYNKPIKANSFEQIRKRIAKFKRNQNIVLNKSLKTDLSFSTNSKTVIINPVSMHKTLVPNLNTSTKMPERAKKPIIRFISSKDGSKCDQSLTQQSTNSFRRIYTNRLLKSSSKKIIIKLGKTISNNLFGR